jgi:hypothetical protein
MQFSLKGDLSTLQKAACVAVDQQAETCRMQYITAGAGQSLTYQQKQAQATAFLAQYPTDADAVSAVASNWPLLANEVGITASDLWGVAHTVSTLAQQWMSVAAQIETLRLGAKKAILAATSGKGVAQAAAVAWPSTG